MVQYLHFKFVTHFFPQMKAYDYEMNPEMEGYARELKHVVYPFYNCDEDRISISGNIGLNTTKLL